MKIKICKRTTHARIELMLLQNVSARVWKNLVAFSSVVNRQDFFNSGSCMRLAMAVEGSNGLTRTSLSLSSTLLFPVNRDDSSARCSVSARPFPAASC